MPTCDLHTHSLCSDGSCTPEEVVSLACSAGLSALALTDHNTFAGLDRAQKAAEGRISFCGGCEFTTEADGQELHLLGLFLEPERRGELEAILETQERLREINNRQTIENLAKVGYSLSYGEFLEGAGAGIHNRVHIARYLMSKGIVGTVSEAFAGLLSIHAGFYRPAKRLDFYEMIPKIRAAGGVTVWAHPLFHVDRPTCQRILTRAKDCGLDGVEVYYPTYTEDDTAFLLELCKKYGLLESGGSDFHGENKPGLRLGTGYGSLCVPLSCYEKLAALAEERKHL